MFQLLSLCRAAEDFVKWQEKTVPVTKESLESAIEWLWELEPISAECHTGPTEAIMESLFDDTVIKYVLPVVFRIMAKGAQ